MNQLSKRILSLLLCLAMLLGGSGAAFAAGDGCGCGTSPFILVRGMDAGALIVNEGTPEESRPLSPDTQTILELVGKVAGPVARFAVTKDYDQLADAVLPVLYDFFEPLSCEPDGSSRHDITVQRYPESMAQYPEFIGNEEYTTGEPAMIRAAAEKIGADHVYLFTYDWRLDPMDYARELNDYVQRVKEETGHSKVSLAGASFGGMIIASYLALYGSEDIDNFTMLSSAFAGTSIVGDLFSGKVEFHKDELIRILKEVAGQEAVNLLLDALDQAGIFDVLMPVLDGIVANLKDRVYDEVFQDTFVTMPGMWDLIALKDYEQAKAYLLDPVEDAQLIARADAYHYQVQAKLPELLREAMANGVHISVVSHYGLQGVPITPSYREQNDNIIDTIYTSGYATCAFLNETLPDGYQQKNTNCKEASHNHISGDRVIDASTALLPEQTWFLKGFKHVGYIYGTPVMDFVLWLCLADRQLTVWDGGEQYSQFMQVDPTDGTMQLIEKPQEGTEPSTQPPASEEETPTTQPQESVQEPTGPEETGPVQQDGEQAEPEIAGTGERLLGLLPLGLAAVAAVALAASKKKYGAPENR